MNTVIITDASCDLPPKVIEDNNISYIGLMCKLKGKEYEDDFGKTISYEEFYKLLRKEEMPVTSQINVYRFTEKFKKYVKEGKSIIYLGISSALSGTVNSAVLARKAILEEYKDADITIIDTKSASIGQGLLVYYACDMLKKGKSKEEIIQWLEDNKLNMNLWFVVQDLMHLKRGGRISGTAATVGTLLNIKPIIAINDNGELINVVNVRGRKKSIKYLIDMFRKKAINPEEQIIGISHGDCFEEAKYLEKLIRDEFKVKDVIINSLGLVIGSHCGPGMLSLCFIGNKR